MFPTAAFRAGRSTDVKAIATRDYHEAIEILRGQGLVYACDCSRRLAAISERRRHGRPANQPNFAIPACVATKNFHSCEGYGWRGCGSSRARRKFEDARCGLQRQDPEQQCGDVLLRAGTATGRTSSP